MLLNFRFSNFKSFNNLADFSMVAGKVRQHSDNLIKFKNVDILKFSSIYGANAGGKSSFVDAIGLSQAIILNDLNDVLIREKYNKNHSENKNKESNFEYEIMIDDCVYSYGFSIVFHSHEIIKEYLLDITDGNEELIFGRNKNTTEFGDKFLSQFSDLERNRLNVYISDLKETETIIKVLNSQKNKLKHFNKEIPVTEKLHNWFDEVLEVISPTGTTKSINLTYLNKQYLDDLSAILEAFDTGVKEVRFDKVSVDQLGLPLAIREKIFEDIRNKNQLKNPGEETAAIIQSDSNIYNVDFSDGEVQIYEIRFKHKSGASTYSLHEESDGTRRIINIVSVLLNEDDKVYVIDELDRSLHPNLSFNFVKRFLNSKSNSQLIVTTHEDRLLDLTLLRRDQVWFVDKNDELDSEIYALEVFKDRFDKDILKAYLQGRYGSVPKLDLIYKTIGDNEK